jgi:hypothetical protein
MTRKEWLECVKLARSKGFTDSSDYTGYSDLTAFSGMALSNDRRTATKGEVASLILGHCATFGGTWLHEEERELEDLYPRIDLVG